MNLNRSDPGHIFALRQLDRFMIGHNGFIAGGCFKNIFCGEPPKDIDVFFETKEAFEDAVNRMSEDRDYETAYESKKVRAFWHKPSGQVVEFVCALFGTPEDLLGNFDFTISKFAYYKQLSENEEGLETCEYKAVYHPLFFEHLHLRRLVIDDAIPFPLSTFGRMLKYQRSGFTPCTETKQKLINAIRGLPESDILVPTNFYAGID